HAGSETWSRVISDSRNNSADSADAFQHSPPLPRVVARHGLEARIHDPLRDLPGSASKPDLRDPSSHALPLLHPLFRNLLARLPGRARNDARPIGTRL